MSILPQHKRRYLYASIVLLLILIIIAKFFNDTFVRPTMGDYLIVLFMYSVVRTFTSLSIKTTAIGVLLFAYTVEILQFIDVLAILGIRKNLATDLIVGSTFDWFDMLAYSLAFLTILIAERKLNELPKIGH